MRRLYYYFIYFTTIQFSFAQNFQETFIASEDNKENLITVLEHFKKTGEKEKFKAASFLIENMHLHESQSYKWIDADGDIVPFSEFHYEDFGIALEAYRKLKDSLQIKPKTEKIKDAKIITSELLIKNINLAFTAWNKNSWSKAYSFKTFCEYILPYRSLFEPLEDWREEYTFLVQRVLLNLKESRDPVEVCTQIINELNGFSFVYGENPLPAPLLSPQQLLFRRQGGCSELANLALLASRASGIAVTFDFTPHYPASSNRHYWNTVIDNKGNHIPFNGNAVGDKSGLPNNYKTNHKRLGKVYRKTYSNQKHTLANKLNEADIPFGFLREKNTLDVTEEYVSTGEINYVNSNLVKDTIAYLNVFNKSRWRTIDWGIKKKKSFGFKKLGRDIVYMPSFYSEGKMTFAKYPILLDSQGKSHVLKPDFNNVFTSTLSRTNEYINPYHENNSTQIEIGEKYILLYWDGSWKRLGDVSTGTKEGVSFKNMPLNALFWLLPKTSNGFERIFILDSITKKIKWY